MGVHPGRRPHRYRDHRLRLSPDFQNAPMRYRDASHVDVSSFYARLPQIGKVYRLLGYAGIVAMLVAIGQRLDCLVTGLIVVLVLIWLAAWYQIVGTLWRSALVASILTGALYLSCERCSQCDWLPTPHASGTLGIPK